MDKKTLAAGLKVVHILAVTSTTGGLSALLLMLFHEPATATATAALRLFTHQVTWGGLVLFVSSALFSLFFDRGILRFRWIALKWLLLVAVTATSWLTLGPALSGLAATADPGLAADAARPVFSDHLATARGSTIAMAALLIAAIGLSTLKPRLGGRREKVSRPERIAGAVLLGAALLGAAFFVASELNLVPMRGMNIADLGPAGLPDGAYAGQFPFGGRNYSVVVKLAGGRIGAVEASDGLRNDYVVWARGVFRRIVWRQTSQVDAVAGATASSKAYLKAVETALLSAGAHSR